MDSPIFFSHSLFQTLYKQTLQDTQMLYHQFRKTQNDFQYGQLVFYFLGQDSQQLGLLQEKLRDIYSFSVQEIQKTPQDKYEIKCESIAFPIHTSTLRYFALDMLVQGKQHDCVLDGMALLATEEKQMPDWGKEHAIPYFDKALALYENGNLFEAILYWTLVLQIDKQDPNAYYSRAIAKQQLYDAEEALKDYDAALALAPFFKEAWVNKGTLWDAIGEHEKAIDCFTNAIKEDMQLAIAYFNRGNSYKALQQLDKAESDWSMAIDLGYKP
ncbi:MAG: hypothetical protein R2831_09795 [Chitinophagaceae bacterium]